MLTFRDWKTPSGDNVCRKIYDVTLYCGYGDEEDFYRVQKYDKYTS